ncbi:MAG: hypothetical protein AB3N63_12465 [Puniceicoccaceae bacterium]
MRRQIALLIILAIPLAHSLWAAAFVTYEDFGAVGDGVHDDMPAICAAHEYANANGLPVKSRPDATYHLGRRALTATIATSTDWGTSRFTIDDRDVEDHKVSLFQVRSLLPMEELKIKRLKRDQKRINLRPGRDYHVVVMNSKVKRYIRRGLNQNSGTSQRDCFILRRDGSIEGDIDWDYDKVTSVEARAMDDEPLVLSGGVFTTFANNMKQEVGYNYWYRNIEITRSNTTVDGLTHYVVGETAVGHPYRGFISVSDSANITLRNCFASGHKTYKTIGNAGKPVSMGSYDYSANSVVNFSMINCRMNHILDRTRWGVIGTNFCKNILLEDCELSRMDTHMGVSGSYVIRRSTLGIKGFNAIGRGLLLVEDSTLHGPSFISLRSDYGSTWEGDVEIRNCRWIPSTGSRSDLNIFSLSNDGQHDFGYTCYMPERITIDGLFVDDTKHNGKLYIFRDPGSKSPDKSPYPYVPTKMVRIRKLATAKGKKPEISRNVHIRDSVELVGMARE